MATTPLEGAGRPQPVKSHLEPYGESTFEAKASRFYYAPESKNGMIL